ncbi:hypothetical protein GJ496_008118 [Pomphorhynchus laevis]|nr:hypothetical protein GJ496_008118 [Pomphorhynchus laevis]
MLLYAHLAIGKTGTCTQFYKTKKSDPLVHSVDIISSTQSYGLPVNHANDGDLDREVSVPTSENHMSTHAQSSTDLPQNQEEPVNDQSDAKDPMTTTKAGEDLNTSN